MSSLALVFWSRGRDLGKDKRPHFKMYVRNWSPINISNRFTSKLHILNKSDNIVHWVFAYRRCDKPDNVQFMKSWKKYAALFDAGLTALWGQRTLGLCAPYKLCNHNLYIGITIFPHIDNTQSKGYN